MSLELDFTIDTAAFSLDEECTYNQLMDMELEFLDTLDMELVIEEGSGGGPGLWKQNPKAELIFPSAIDMQEEDIENIGDTKINGLKSVTNGGDVADADYNWFKGLFPALVDGSVKSYIIGLLTVVKDLATRVGLLEDKYILKYVVPVDTTSINLTTDKYGNAFNFVEGDKFEVSFSINAWVFVSSNLSRILLRINNLATSIYYISGIAPQPEFITAGTAYKSQRTMLSLTVNNGEVIGMVTNQSVTGADARVSELYTLHTKGLNASSIVSINLRLPNNASLIPAGTVILVKKL